MNAGDRGDEKGGKRWAKSRSRGKLEKIEEVALLSTLNQALQIWRRSYSNFSETRLSPYFRGLRFREAVC